MNFTFPNLILIFLVPLQLLGQVKIKNYSLQNPDTTLLYVGIENKLHVSGIKNIAKVRIELNGRNYYADKNGQFNILASSIGPGVIHVFENFKLAYSKTYYANRISEPIVLLGNFRDTTLSKSEILNYDKLRAIFPYCILDYYITIASFELKLISKQKELNISNKISGNKIPSSLLDLIKKLDPGDKLVFENIRLSGPDDLPIDSFYITLK